MFTPLTTQNSLTSNMSQATNMFRDLYDLAGEGRFRVVGSGTVNVPSSSATGFAVTNLTVAHGLNTTPLLAAFYVNEFGWKFPIPYINITPDQRNTATTANGFALVGSFSIVAYTTSTNFIVEVQAVNITAAATVNTPEVIVEYYLMQVVNN